MQAEEDNRYPKCESLESPKRLYDRLLFHISEKLSEKDKDNFIFAFRSDLPRTVLDSRKPLSWFNELEQRDKLSPGDLSCLVNFFRMVSLNSLLNYARSFQARWSVIVFFQKKLEGRMPGLCLAESLNSNWESDESLPKNFLKKCREWFRGIQGSTEIDFWCSLSKGLTLLENSCQPFSHDAHFVAMKVLYLSNLVFKRFGALVIDRKDMVKLLLSGSIPGPMLHAAPRRERPPAHPPDLAMANEMENPIAERRILSEVLRDFDWPLATYLVICLFCIMLIRLFDWWKEKENGAHSRNR